MVQCLELGKTPHTHIYSLERLLMHAPPIAPEVWPSLVGNMALSRINLESVTPPRNKHVGVGYFVLKGEKSHSVYCMYSPHLPDNV